MTGLGAVTGAGCDRQSLERALAAGIACTTPVGPVHGCHLPNGARTAVRVAGFDPRPWIPAASLRRMSPPSRFAVTAARMALADAGFESTAVAGADLAVVLGTSFGACDFSERILRQIFLEGPLAASPFHFTESVANAPAAQVAIACQARGPNLTVTQREASAVVALDQAAREVARGRVSRALVGAVDELTPLLHAVLDRFHAVARGGPDGAELARPFDRRRNGCLAAEGAVVAVLESESASRRRQAVALARCRRLGSAFDLGAPVAGWSRDPEPLAAALVRLLARAGLAAADFDCIVSGASGSRDGDRLEALVLRRVWGGRPLPPLLAPKAILGEHGGALLATAVLALAGAPFGGTPNGFEMDPELGVRPHTGGALPPLSRVLVTSLAAGGAAAWVALERVEP